MTQITCAICGKKLDSHNADCPRCAANEQKQLRSVRIVNDDDAEHIASLRGWQKTIR